MRRTANPKLDRLPEVPERQLATDFERYLRMLGPHALWYHTHDSRRSVPGFPDYIVVVGGYAYAFELKRHGGRVTADQAAWLDRLAGAEVTAAVLWGPDGIAEAVRIIERRRAGAQRPRLGSVLHLGRRR